MSGSWFLGFSHPSPHSQPQSQFASWILHQEKWVKSQWLMDSTLLSICSRSTNNVWFYLTHKSKLTFSWTSQVQRQAHASQINRLGLKSATLTLVSCWPSVTLVLKTVQIHATNSNNKRKLLKTSPLSARLTIFIEPYQCVINTSSFKAINLSHPNPSQETSPREERICRAIAERQAVRKPMQKFALSVYTQTRSAGRNLLGLLLLCYSTLISLLTSAKSASNFPIFQCFQKSPNIEAWFGFCGS